MALQFKQTEARGAALQFLYQCEMEKIYFFSEIKFKNFVSHHKIEKDLESFLCTLIQGVMDRAQDLDKEIVAFSQHWSLDRIPVLDKLILRQAIFELQHTQTPTKVILNEAIELAKKYSTEKSSKFVNGLLDGVAKKLRT